MGRDPESKNLWSGQGRARPAGSRKVGQLPRKGARDRSHRRPEIPGECWQADLRIGFVPGSPRFSSPLCHARRQKMAPVWKKENCRFSYVAMPV